MFAALLIFALAIAAAAQMVTFREGNSVQTPDGRIGVIESFKNQEMAKVKFGENDSQYFMLTTLKVVKPPKPPLTEPLETFRASDLVENDKGQQLRIDSISGDSAVVRYGVGKYNVYTEKLENLTSVKTVAARRERENAGKLVRAQFEDDSKPFFDLIITVAPGFDPKYRLEFSFNPVNATYEKWTKELTALSVVCQKYPNLTNPLDAGATMPMELFAPLDEKVAELKARIEADAPTRNWEQPKFKDTALEATARREFSTDLPGLKVLKTGLIHSIWDVDDGKDYIGGNSGGYYYYRIIKGASRNRYGRALVQLPNRPFCQIRAFQITQLKAGAGYGSTSASSSDSGVFVKCP